MTFLFFLPRQLMFKLFIFFTGVLSFLHFLNPHSFDSIGKTGEKVLGVKSFNQAVNSETVKTAITIYCIDKGHLPSHLNELFEEELMKDRYVDLDKLYKLEDLGNCEFELTGE